jgi:hypothetical protein
VSQPIKPAFEAAVTTQPILAMELRSEKAARNESQENSDPGQQQIQFGNVRFHTLAFSSFC